jgi:hypothetical protein
MAASFEDRVSIPRGLFDYTAAEGAHMLVQALR